MPFEPLQDQTNRPPRETTQPSQYGFQPLSTDDSDAVKESHSLLGRFGKQIVNVLPSTVRETIYGLGGGKILSIPVSYMLRKRAREKGIDLSYTDANKLYKQGVMKLMGKETDEALLSTIKPKINIPEYRIDPAETTPEKLVDAAAGITTFVAELAALRKIVPGASEKSLWEIQNLISGGTPGHGALMHSVFGLPGKLIPGASKLARTGRLAAESALLGGTTALEQKLAAGEIDWKDVAISAGIPPALRSLGYVQSRLRAKDRAVIEATRKVESKAIETEQPVDAETTIKKLQTWAKEPKLFNIKERAEARKKFRTEQAAGGREQKEIAADLSAQERLRRIKRGFKGEAEMKEFEPPQLADSEWNSLSQKIETVYKDDIFNQSNVQDLIDGIRKGTHIPTDPEFAKLEPIFGTDVTIALHKTLRAPRKFSPWDVPKVLISAFKSPFGYDPQAARQLAPIMFRHPIIYARAVWKNIRSYIGKDYAAKLAKQLESDPMWKISQEKAGINLLGTKPWTKSKAAQTRLQQYGDFTEWLNTRKNRVAKKWGQLLSASERGANLGIDYGMLELAKQAGKRLDRIQNRLARQGKPIWTESQIDKYWKDAGKDINAFTKRVVARHPSAKQIQNAANYVLFSPAYTVSYPYRSWRVLKELFAGTSGNRTMATQYVLSQIAGLTALSSIAAYAAHKHRANDPSSEPPIDSSINPMNSLWGHFRHGTNVYDFTFGEGSYYRLLARIGASAYLHALNLTTGKKHTLLFGKTAPKAGEEFKRYLTSRETVVLGLGKAILSGKDWLGNPIDTQFVINNMMPMSALKDLVDAGYANGTWEALSQGDIGEGSKKLLGDIPPALTGSFGAGVTSYEVNPAATRSNFRNLMAQREYKKSWNDLTKTEQTKLTRKYRDVFAGLAEKIAKHYAERPYSAEQKEEEERRSGNIIRKKLDRSIRDMFSGISLNINRSPQKHFLNDERYNRYMELIAKHLNQRASKLKLDGLRPEIRRTMLKSVVQYAKTRAYYDLMKEEKEK